MLDPKKLHRLTKTCGLKSWNMADPESSGLRLSVPPLAAIPTTPNIQLKTFWIYA